jgi:hypothetical protein
MSGEDAHESDRQISSLIVAYSARSESTPKSFIVEALRASSILGISDRSVNWRMPGQGLH